MSSRDQILAAVKQNQPAKQKLPDVKQLDAISYDNLVQQYTTVLQNIGGTLVNINNLNDVTAYVTTHYAQGHQLITTIDGLAGLSPVAEDIDPHDLETVELAVLPAVIGVAENGAVWLTEKEMKVRVVPFIPQHLAVVLEARNIVPNMHVAYEMIAANNYGFGAFIAGPSKTADIEQSLVLGAHGPRSMTVFLLG